MRFSFKRCFWKCTVPEDQGFLVDCSLGVWYLWGFHVWRRDREALSSDFENLDSCYRNLEMEVEYSYLLLWTLCSIYISFWNKEHSLSLYATMQQSLEFHSGESSRSISYLGNLEEFLRLPVLSELCFLK